MRPKHRALLYNFIGFAFLFIGSRLLLGHFFSMGTFILAFLAAVIATILAPKFAVVKTPKGEKLMMKWIFIKGIREM